MLVHRREVVRREVRAMTARELQDKGGGTCTPKTLATSFISIPCPSKHQHVLNQVGLFQLLLMIKTL
jgi:hypothetical protein